MKKMLVLAGFLFIMAGCKNTEEVKIDETKVETPVDSIVQKDTIAVLDTIIEPVEDKVVTAQIEKPSVTVSPVKEVKVDYASFGSKIASQKALSKEEMLKKYTGLKKGDTIAVKFKSKITAVCKKKGCWMKMDLADKKESFVRFKDYGFFVPLNADNSEAIVSGRAYIDEISVDELKHYAKDGGKSQEEIDKITSPKITYAFQADGVLIQQ